MNIFNLSLFISCSAFISGASTTPTTSDFLAEPSQLQQEDKDLRYRNPDFQSKHYQEALKTAFQADFTIHSKPSNDTLTVRSAITALNSVNIAANAILAVVAVLVDNGGASTETEITVRGVRQYAESRSVTGGFTGSGSFKSKAVGYLSKTSHIKAALTTIANDLAKKAIEK